MVPFVTYGLFYGIISLLFIYLLIFQIYIINKLHVINIEITKYLALLDML
jgi:hypothetical protein